MKKIVMILFLPLTIFAMCDLKTNTKEELLIENFENLKMVGKGDCPLNADYRLVNDVDADPKESFKPILGFSGNFHGAGHIIRNLYIYNNMGGLFNSMDGTIDSLGLENITVYSGRYAGSIVGLYGTGTIREVFVKGIIDNSQGEASNLNAAGGIAAIFDGIIKDSYFEGSVSGNGNVGGIVGENGGTVERCYAVNESKKVISAGSLVGLNNGNIKSSFGTGIMDRIVNQDDGNIDSWSMHVSTAEFENDRMNRAIFYKESETEIWPFNKIWKSREFYGTPVLMAFLKRSVVSAKNIQVDYCSNELLMWNIAFENGIDQDKVFGSVGAEIEVKNGKRFIYTNGNKLSMNSQTGYWFDGDTIDISGRIPLNVEGLEVENKVYDGSLKAILKGNASLVGVCSDDDVFVGGTPIASFESADVGEVKKVFVDGLLLRGNSEILDKYELIMPELYASIFPESSYIGKMNVVKSGNKLKKSLYKANGTRANHKENHIRIFVK